MFYQLRSCVNRWLPLLAVFYVGLGSSACETDKTKKRTDAEAQDNGSQDAGVQVREACSDQQPCAPTGNPCSVATCTAGVCEVVVAPNGTSCDDLKVCTDTDECRAGVCAGLAKSCDDGLACSADSCDETFGGCTSDRTTCACEKDDECDDSNACNGIETCDPIKRTCLRGTAVSCKALDNSCNVGMCNASNGTCTATPRAEGAACNDENACTLTDICTQGTCGGTPIACAAQDSCHLAGVCDATSGTCSNPVAPEGSTCDDMNACTNGDACVAGQCQPGASLTCVATDECHAAGTCAPATGVCSSPELAGGTACNDGSACTGSDVCSAGVCKGTPTVCDDGLACSVDSCSETAGCTTDVRMCGCQKHSDCDDGNACNGAETCDLASFKCLAGTAKDCSTATTACSVGVCNAANGVCEAKPRPNGTTCGDGNACTRTDACLNGQCLGSNPIVCTASDACHAAGMCDPQTGACSDPARPNGTACNDTNACTQTDTCQSGACAGGNPIVCTAADVCHVAGVCNHATGTCSLPNAPNGTQCDDRNMCTRTDTCQGGTCGGGNPVVCMAQDQCHSVGTCNPGSGACTNPVKIDGTLCSDGNACTRTDACQTGACQGGNAVVCTALDECHDVGACDPASGVCANPAKANGAACNDNDACTRSDTCTAGACMGGNPVECAAIDACHAAGTCSPATGTCSTPNAADGTDCNDGRVCTATDKCTAGRCGGTAITCNDGIACTVDACTEAQGGCTVDRSTCGCASNADCNDGNACNGVETCNLQTLSCNRGNAVNCAGLDTECAVGACIPATGACVASPRPDGTTCNDTSACTQRDSCAAGRCVSNSPVVCPQPDQCHTIGTCDTGTGVCSNPAKVNGSTCNDGNACTQTDSCQSGVCNGGNPILCTPVDVCHLAGACNTGTGQCSSPAAPNGTRCNDGNACTQTDSCQNGSCSGGNPVTCVALDQCHIAGRCDTGNGACSNPEAPVNTPCNDNNACTRSETCQQGRCTPASSVTCVSMGTCFDAGVCDPTKGSCSMPPSPDGTICTDTDLCTLAERCTAGKCGGTGVLCTSPPTCQQGGMCIKDGSCAYSSQPDRTPCDDSSACTLADACTSGQCSGQRRSNKAGDWNLTPVLEGVIRSVDMDTFDKVTMVAGTFQGVVRFDKAVLDASKSIGAYVANYDLTGAVLAADLVMQASSSLEVHDVAAHADGSFVIVGTCLGTVNFASNAKLGFTTARAQEAFVAGFDVSRSLRWVRRGRGVVPINVDAYDTRAVIVVGTADKGAVLFADATGNKPVGLDPMGTFAARYEDGGDLSAASVVAYAPLQGLKVSVSNDSGLAAIAGTGVAEITFSNKDVLPTLGGQDVFFFAVTPDLQVAWANQVGGRASDEIGGVTAFENGFAVFASVMGDGGAVRGKSTGTRPLFGFVGRGLQGHVLTVAKDGTAIGAALVASRNGLPVRAWDIAQSKGSRLMALGTFNLQADIWGAIGFGSGEPKAPPDRSVSNQADGNSLFGATFESEAVKSLWGVNLRGTNAAIGVNPGNDALVVVHPDLSATAGGMFLNTATFGDQVTNLLSPGQGSFFLSHFNSRAEYDFCPQN